MQDPEGETTSVDSESYSGCPGFSSSLKFSSALFSFIHCFKATCDRDPAGAMFLQMRLLTPSFYSALRLKIPPPQLRPRPQVRPEFLKSMRNDFFLAKLVFENYI